MRPGYWSRFLNNNLAMKNYLESLSNAVKQQIQFLSDNPGTALISIFIGVCGWLLEFIEVYIFSDFRYLLFLLLMIGYDAFSGIERVKYMHRLDPLKNPKPDPKTFKDKTVSKLIYYLIMLSSLHGIAHFQVKSSEVTVFHAFEYAALVLIMATEFWSVQENYAAIGRKTIFLLAWEKLKDILPSSIAKPQ